MEKRPALLGKEDVERFLRGVEGWKIEGNALEKTYGFPNYGATMAFAVEVGFAAEKRDHHPDLKISWGKVEVRWSTHDAGGITALDVELATLCDLAYRR